MPAVSPRYLEIDLYSNIFHVFKYYFTLRDEPCVTHFCRGRKTLELVNEEIGFLLRRERWMQTVHSVSQAEAKTAA